MNIDKHIDRERGEKERRGNVKVKVKTLVLSVCRKICFKIFRSRIGKKTSGG